eukprot:TRINITY_DN11681_c0_g1_i1.p1 TRINITY_DN11681_c0_g1~~TRINITY_DN11681_c0_g1_i1.p1  ORF type:complete len:437 (+),score=107.03 TRINITY_DN11681_c0_g1_i1:58-1368(+)
MSKFGGGGIACTKCGKTSYAAETIAFEEKPFHRECFRCTKCSKKLESTAQAAMFDVKIYCTPCFQKEGFARNQTKITWRKSESKTANSAFHLGGGGVPCGVCQKTVYGGEAVNFESKTYHPKCLKCTECAKECTVNTVAKFEDKLYCKHCFTKNNFAQKQAQVKFSKSPTRNSTSSPYSNLGGGGERCEKCGGTVYSAEMVVYEGLKYHAKCFKCTHCGKELKVNVSQHNNKQPYCTKCYTELGLHRAQVRKTPTPASSATPSTSPSIETSTASSTTTTTTATTAAPVPSPTVETTTATTTASVSVTTTESVAATTTTTASTEATPTTTTVSVSISATPSASTSTPTTESAPSTPSATTETVPTPVVAVIATPSTELSTTTTSVPATTTESASASVSATTTESVSVLSTAAASVAPTTTETAPTTTETAPAPTTTA